MRCIYFSCTKQAVEGACLSGVEVATIMRFTSSAVIPASSSAIKATLEAKSLVTSPSTILRSLILNF